MTAVVDRRGMRVWPRFAGRLGLADAITVANAGLGFVAVVTTPVAPRLAARFILLAAIADGLDGVVARHRGGTEVGHYLDALADVASFGVAPALLLAAVALEGWGLDPTTPSPRAVLAVGVSTLFLAMVVVRLGLYTAHDADAGWTEGVQSTLAATVVAAGVLALGSRPALAVGAGALLAYLMVIRVPYPDLLARDAFIMGSVQAVAVLAPTVLGRAFPYALLVLALAYVTLAPRFYWRPRPD